MKVCWKCNRTDCTCKKPAARSKAQYHDKYYRRSRESYLSENPYCADCRRFGRITIATEIHHTKRLVEHPEALLDTSVFLGLCKPCHSVRTAKGE